MITQLDDYLQERAQALYDTVWDRWGVLIGTIRFGAISLPSMGYITEIWLSGSNPILFGIVVVATGLNLFTFLTRHTTECRLQEQQRYSALNAMAVHFRQRFSVQVRLIFLALVVLLSLAFTWITLLVALVGYFGWSYACGVTVRDRQERREWHLAEA